MNLNQLTHMHRCPVTAAGMTAPAECCLTVFEEYHRRERDEALRVERHRIITATLAAIEAYAAAAGSLLTNEQSKDMLGLIVSHVASEVRKAGCICPRIDVTAYDGLHTTIPGRDPHCGLHGGA